jgi:nucleoside-diphosphate-sugar epimerase
MASEMAARALVVGGTGPTGPYLVRGLLARGYAVAILHRGTHESDEIPPEVEHIHADPYDAEAFATALGARAFDVVVATYGRLREVARVCAGRAGQFLGIGGVPLYRGWMRPEDLVPRGLPVPLREDAPQVESAEELRKGFMIRRTEEAVFGFHPRATMFRYPTVYGPRQLLPLEWCIVRRVLDGRPHIVLPDGGLTLSTAGYAENLAHAVLLAVDRPDAAAGQSYNCGDQQTLTLRQRVETIAQIMGRAIEIVSVPAEVALPAWPLLTHEASDHRLMDLGKIQRELGYRDVVPAPEALRRTVEWLVSNRPEPGGLTEQILGDPFDYEAEDRLVAVAREGLERMRAVSYATPPSAGASYVGKQRRGLTRAAAESATEIIGSRHPSRVRE